MSVTWMVGTIVSVIISSVLAYWVGYYRGWLVGAAEVLEDVYVNEGDADE
jgi:hypothetical protein